MKRRSFCIAAIAGFGLACASTNGGGPETFEALRAREVDLPAATEIVAPDGSFSASAAGTLVGEIAAVENGWRGTFDIGTSGPIECVFYHEALDPASALDEVGRLIFQELEKRIDIGERRILAIDAGNVGPAPFLAIDWVAFVDDAAAQFKFKVASKGDRSIYCAHPETGYASTFDAFFRELVDSYDGAAIPEVVFRDISIASIDETRVGFQSIEMAVDDEGDFRIDVRGSMLLPAGPDVLSVSDEASIEFSTPEGSLINAVAVVSDGSDVTELTIEPNDAGWHVTGEMQGKRIDATIETAEPLLSVIGEFGVLARIAGEPAGAEASYHRWIGAMNPTEATPHSVRSLGDSTVEVKSGAITMVSKVDDRGIPASTLAVGRVDVEIERVWVEGRPVLP